MTQITDTTTTKLIHYVIDPKASRFTVQAFASGMLAAMGHNPTIGIRGFSGEVDFSPDSPEAARFRLRINAGSLSVLDDVSDKDRREMEQMMNERVLEPAKFLEIVYEAPAVSVAKLQSNLYAATLNGNLSLHGVMRAQPIVARVADFGEMLRTSGELTVRQSDYGIKPIAVAGGALKVKDEIKFSFEIVARKQG